MEWDPTGDTSEGLSTSRSFPRDPHSNKQWVGRMGRHSMQSREKGRWWVRNLGIMMSEHDKPWKRNSCSGRCVRRSGATVVRGAKWQTCNSRSTSRWNSGRVNNLVTVVSGSTVSRRDKQHEQQRKLNYESLVQIPSNCSSCQGDAKSTWTLSHDYCHGHESGKRSSQECEKCSSTYPPSTVLRYCHIKRMRLWSCPASDLMQES